MTLPYTYLIGWSTHNIWYYGSRYAKNCHPSDLWTSYFTSSNYVVNMVKTYGEPDIIEIRKTFETASQAREWEHKVLRRLDVIHQDKWLNKTNNRAILLDDAMKAKIRAKTQGRPGKPHTKETKEKLRQAKLGKEPWNKGLICPQIKSMTGKKHTAESNEKNRQAHLGKTQSAESNLKRSIAQKGRVFSEETREKLRQAALLREAKKKLPPV